MKDDAVTNSKIIDDITFNTGSFSRVESTNYSGEGGALTGVATPASVTSSFAQKSAVSGSFVTSSAFTGNMGDISGSSTSTGSFGRVEVAGDLSVSSTLHLGAFEARLTSTQSVNHNVTTTVDFNGDGEEVIDVDSYWDNANNRYQPTVAGKYFLCAETSLNLDEGEQAILFIREDGTTNLTYHVVCGGGADNDVTLQTSCIVTADTSNWFEMAIYQLEGAAQNLLASNRTRFHGFRVT